jgi:hypothetical protein
MFFLSTLNSSSIDKHDDEILLLFSLKNHEELTSVDV